MSANNKEIVRKINRGFETGDVESILSYIADDVRWFVPGAFTAIGKDEFRKQIINEAFDGPPTITIKNEIAEGDYVAVEGSVTNKRKDGGMLGLLFHNTYRLESGKVKEMTSYLVQK